MTLNRWKVLACTLTIGVGGLAVFATPPVSPPDKPEPAREPAPLPDLSVKPTSPTNGTDTPAPDTPARGAEFDLDIPLVPAPARPEVPMPKKADETSKPASLPVFEPITPPAAPVVPVKAEDPAKTEEKKPAADKVPDVVVAPVAKPEPPAVPMVAVPVPDAPKADPVKPPMLVRPDLPGPEPVNPTERTPPVVSPVPPLATPTPPASGTPAPAPTGPDTMRVPLVPPAGASAAHASAPKLKLLLRMGDGQPRFEIRNTSTTELLLKVYGERVEMQAPPDAKSSLAGVTAMGRVRFTAPGIEGTCDHLTILSGTGEVLLKGNIHMKSKRGKGWSEMTAEKMVYQIGTSGLSTGTPRPTVTPASYIPD